MGQIHLADMEFYAFHGHFKEEQIVGSKFLVDLILETDMTRVSETDNLADAVNYQSAYKLVKREMGQKSHMMENLAKRILDAIFDELPGVLHATVSIRKMNPPIGGKIKSAGVELSR